MKMINFIRYVQLAAVLFVLASTLIAFFIELKVMYEQRHIALADLLLMFIYIEVIGLVRSYWETRAVRITYPLVIAITALARYIILQDKDGEPATLIYIALSILIISIAAVVIRMRNSKYLKIDYTKSNDL
jgi:protein PsiE